MATRPCDALRRQRGERHDRFSAHRMTNKGGFLYLPIVRVSSRSCAIAA